MYNKFGHTNCVLGCTTSLVSDPNCSDSISVEFSFKCGFRQRRRTAVVSFLKFWLWLSLLNFNEDLKNLQDIYRGMISHWSDAAGGKLLQKSAVITKNRHGFFWIFSFHVWLLCLNLFGNPALNVVCADFLKLWKCLKWSKCSLYKIHYLTIKYWKLTRHLF